MSKPDNVVLSKRLEAIAATVAWDSCADIGCDHGLLTAALIKNGAVTYAVASDVKPGPLKSAEDTFERLGIRDKVEMRLGGGLGVLSPGEVKSCVIAGMGGMNIISILGDSVDVLESLEQLVLSPERDYEAVRRFLHSVNFYLHNEYLVEENGHFYFIFDARKGNEPEYDDVGYMYGAKLLEEKNDILRKYLLKEKFKTDAVINSLLVKQKAVKTALNIFS